MGAKKIPKQNSFDRLEDSFSLRENQKSLPEDSFIENENKRLAAKWREKLIACRKQEKNLGVKFC